MHAFLLVLPTECENQQVQFLPIKELPISSAPEVEGVTVRWQRLCKSCFAAGGREMNKEIRLSVACPRRWVRWDAGLQTESEK